ncbi:hypothetical protein GMDG_00303 [Pseudogymnoascus destructans 20631-21]|uniref:F-box domain-containing protein n=1 Tax=Pseudogymnoascus destructans (strain ATCC MYA-4855 / 20631-21) TaxID=658429 RepID=L8G416_PSED2|nr:hypothetical protein GMDG_00303 [Pseudogymnoascus destructans 20631-21]
MDTFEPLDTIDSIIPSQVEMEPIEPPPKLKGRQRLLHSLERMSSATSLKGLSRKRAISNPYSSTSSRGSAISFSNIQSSQAGSSSSFSRLVTGHQATTPISSGSTPPTSVSGLSNLASRPWTANLDDGGPGSSHTSHPGIQTVDSDIIEIDEGYFAHPVALSAIKPSKPNPNFDFWGNLPEELRLSVLSHLRPKDLVRASIVSRLFYSMCFDGQLWTCFDASEFYTAIPADSLAKIVSAAGPFVKDLNLRGCVQVEHYNRADVVVKSCNNLITATLEGCRNFQRATLHILLSSNQRLAHLNLTDLAAVNNGSCKIISKSCPQLESFNVSWCSHMDSRGLKLVIAGCPKLRDLRCGEVRGFSGAAGLEVATALFKTNNLERLVLSGCSDITDATLQTMIQGSTDPDTDILTNLPLVPARKLRHLDLSRCSRLTDTALESLAHCVPYLQGLQLSSCALLTDSSLSALVATTPYLTHLDLEEVSNLSNTFLSSHLSKSLCAPNLSHLTLSYCENIGDLGVLPLLRAATGLKALDMDNTAITDLVLAEAAQMVRTRASLTPLPLPTISSLQVRATPTLKLVIFDCPHITWPGIREILSRNSEMLSLPPGRREVVALKCYYGWQMTVDEHLKRVLAGERQGAERLERKWAEHMVASEENPTTKMVEEEA